MKRATRFYFFNLRLLIGLLILFAGAILGLFAKANPKALTQGPARYLRPFPSGGVQEAWVARYNGPGNGYDVATAIAVDNAGNICVTGTSSDDYATIKYSPVGQELWVARYDGAGTVDQANAIAVDGQGNVYVTGQSFTSFTQGLSDFATIKYNAAGQEQWVARYPGSPIGTYAAAAIVLDNRREFHLSELRIVNWRIFPYQAPGFRQWHVAMVGRLRK